MCYLVFVWCAAGRRAWARRLAPVGRSCHAWPRFGGGSWLWESRPSSSRCRARRNRRITNSSRSYWDSRGGRRVSHGAGARGSHGRQPGEPRHHAVRPGTQPGRAPPATGLVMQGLRHPSQPTKSSVPGTAGAGAVSHLPACWEVHSKLPRLLLRASARGPARAASAGGAEDARAWLTDYLPLYGRSASYWTLGSRRLDTGKEIQ